LKKIDIVLAVYNGEVFLKEQINSIFNQTYQNFHLIIINDASTDKSKEIIQEYMKKHKNISYYENEKNLGHVKSFERGLSLSRANYIAFCDQDDIWHPEKLELQLNKIKEYDNIPALVHSDLEMIDEKGNTINQSYFGFRGYEFSDKKSLNKIISQNGVMGNTILMNKELKKLVLPFPKYLVVHDYWIALVNELFGKRITIKKPLVKYRIHTNNASNNKNSFTKQIKISNKLPYRGINREKVLEELLNKFDISKEDMKIIKVFLDYLYLNGNRLMIFKNLIKYDLIKKGYLYRLKILLKMLLQ